MRAALSLSRLALWRERRLSRPADGKYQEYQGQAEGLSGARTGRPRFRVYGAIAGAGAAALGSVRLAPCRAPNRDQCHRLQLAAMPGEYRRPDTQRLVAWAFVQICLGARRPSGGTCGESQPYA